MRNFRRACAALCLCAGLAAAAGARQIGRPTPRPLPTPQPQVTPPPQRGGQPPSMKKADRVEVPPARERRSYDRARDATFVNIEITLLAPPEAGAGREAKARDEAKGKGKGGAKGAGAPTPPAFAGRLVTLTFQLAYRGAQTYDLIAAYLIVESTAAPDTAARLNDATRLELRADPYEFTYDRADYKTETVALTGSADARTPPVRRELAAFRVPTEDLPHITGAGALVLKLGAETFPIKSAQLSELRRTLADGAKE